VTRTVPEESQPLLLQAAREVARQFAGFVTLEDMQQEALLWALSNPRKVAEYLGDEDKKQGSRMLYAGVRNRLRWVAVREKAARIGYSPADLAWYSVEQIEKELLPCVFDPSKWASPPKDGEDLGVRSTADPAHGNSWMAMLADVADAFKKLPLETQFIVRAKYEHDWKQRAIAEWLGIAESSVSERLTRAVRKMHQHLGGDRPEYEEDEIRIGRRSALSNAAAQAITGAEYDGE
jgi:RNA polymerase sigma factor (sigma-70 family)